MTNGVPKEVCFFPLKSLIGGLTEVLVYTLNEDVTRALDQRAPGASHCVSILRWSSVFCGTLEDEAPEEMSSIAQL